MTEFIDQFYHVERLHSALAYCSTEELKEAGRSPARELELSVRKILQDKVLISF